ncbi:MAG: methyltransferase [Propionibacteriaceae bacterium]|nr:methyltransferase [Propionibacteriaceae bacterium]
MTLDPVSRLLLDEAASRPPAQQPDHGRTRPNHGHPREGGDLQSRPAPGVPGAATLEPLVLVIDDPALADHLHTAGREVRAYCDDLREERELTFPPLTRLDQPGLADVSLVLLRLPKSLGMLEDYAQRVAAFASPAVRLLAGGREKHLTRSMNEVLGRSFGAVRASLGRQKARVLHAAGPIPGTPAWPHRTTLDGLTLVSHAGAFAADKLDGGTRLLLHALRARPQSSPSRAVDLGCGTGILATWLARQGHHVLAIDVSRAACASASDTADANGVQIEVERAAGLRRSPSSVDLVVCNPPFHRGTTKDSTPGFDLIRSAIPALAPGAEFWTVFNSHLPYLPFLRAGIGRTRVVARDRHYTVTCSRRSG